MTLRLEDRAVIAISGPEARDFLQGLVTNDVRQVGPTVLRYAALLTPQGKILFDFLIGESDETLLLDTPAQARDALARRLTLYRLRARVDVAIRNDLAVVWQPGADCSPPFARDPRHPALGSRAFVRAADAPPATGAERFQALRLENGVPEGHDFGQDKIFALDSDLDELGGIAFDKGCYVGQELTARMKHRGTARKRLLPITASGAAVPDAPVVAAGREVGTIFSAYGSLGFALVRLDRLEEAGATPLTAADIAVNVMRPDWLFS
jgi:folate-binding protein YgfZ